MLGGGQGLGRLQKAQKSLCIRRWHLIEDLANVYTICAGPRPTSLGQSAFSKSSANSLTPTTSGMESSGVEGAKEAHWEVGGSCSSNVSTHGVGALRGTGNRRNCSGGSASSSGSGEAQALTICGVPLDSKVSETKSYYPTARLTY